MSKLEDDFELQYGLSLLGPPGSLTTIIKAKIPMREYRFDFERRWKFDFAWPMFALALEIEGGTWVSGRHSRGAGMRADCEKYNAAVLAGWKVLRVTSDMVRDGSALNLVEQAIHTFAVDALP